MSGLQYYNKHNTNDQTTFFQQASLNNSLSSFHLKIDAVFKMLCFKKLMVTNGVQNSTIFTQTQNKFACKTAALNL